MTSGLSCSPLHVQNGQTALFIASWKGHDQIVELLLRREANVNHQIKVRLLMLVCVCSFMRSVVFSLSRIHTSLVPRLLVGGVKKYLCITMSKVTSYVQQIKLQRPGHNLDSIKFVSVHGQVCAQDN